MLGVGAFAQVDVMIGKRVASPFVRMICKRVASPFDLLFGEYHHCSQCVKNTDSCLEAFTL